MVRLRTILVSLTLLTTACGSVATAEASIPPEASTDTLVLRIEQVGGFVAPATNYIRLPRLSIYADGRVITQEFPRTPYPGPALPYLDVRRISPRNVRRLADRARAAGVGNPADFGTPGIADATTTRFTLAGSGRPRTTEVYALGEATDHESGLTDRQRANRARMRDLQQSLTDLRSTLGADAVGRAQPYRPAAIAALNSAWSANGTQTSPVAWPGAALPGQRLNPPDLSCATSTGAAAARVLAAAATAHPETPWTYRGKRYAIMLRPLLPDERSCADLAR